MKTFIKPFIIVTLTLFFNYNYAQTSFGDGAGTGGGTSCSYFGFKTGSYNNAANNTFIGAQSGHNCTQGTGNTFLGFKSGINTNSNNNTIIGASAGESNTSGFSNTFLGVYAGQSNTTGSKNTYLGFAAGGAANPQASKNIYIGDLAGWTSQGSNNIFIGELAGFDENGNFKLVIANGSNRLISGDFATNKLSFNAKVGIGTTTPQHKLDVCGTARAKEVNVEIGWCDYVFANDYQLPTLEKEEAFIKENGHLLSFQSEAEMNGEIQLGDVTKRQQETIEKLMLHVIELSKKIEALEAKANIGK